MIRSGAKASTLGIRLSKALRQTSRGAPSGETALTMLAEAGSRRMAGAGPHGPLLDRGEEQAVAAVEAPPGCRCRGGCRSRPPRPCARPAAWAARAATATLEKMQKPIGGAGSAWWPGGRTAQKARSVWPAATSRTAWTTAPAARRAAFRLPADMKVSGVEPQHARRAGASARRSRRGRPADGRGRRSASSTERRVARRQVAGRWRRSARRSPPAAARAARDGGRPDGGRACPDGCRARRSCLILTQIRRRRQMPEPTIRRAGPADAETLAAHRRRDLHRDLRPPLSRRTTWRPSWPRPTAWSAPAPTWPTRPRPPGWWRPDGEAIGYALAGPCGLPHAEVTPGLRRAEADLLPARPGRAAAWAGGCSPRSWPGCRRDGPARRLDRRLVGEPRRPAILRAPRLREGRRIRLRGRRAQSTANSSCGATRQSFATMNVKFGVKRTQSRLSRLRSTV